MAQELSPEQFDYVSGELQKNGATPEQVSAIMEQHGYAVKRPGMLRQAADYGLRAYDYTAGLGRGAVGGAMQAATGKDLGVNIKDVLTGKAPSTSQMLGAGGVPVGGSLSDVVPQAYSETGNEWLKLKKGGLLDPTTRGVVGFIGDVALDPMTYLTMGINPALKAAAKTSAAAKAADIALNPLAKGIEATGENIFKSGLKKIDTRAIEKGGEAVSPYMLEQGVWGTLPTVQKKMNERLANLGEQRAALYKDIPATVNPSEASAPALEYLSKLEANPYMAPKVQEGLDYLSLANKPMSLEQASKVKSELYDTLPASMFDPLGKPTNMGKELNKNLSQGYRQEIINSAEAAKPGSGEAIDKINQEMGAYLGAQKPLRSELAKDARKDAQTQVDFMTMFEPAIWGLKQTGKVVNATAPRTGAGLLLNRAGQQVPEQVWRQLLLQNTDKREKK